MHARTRRVANDRDPKLGIGRAVAIAFAREGADVAIGYFAEKEEEDAKETLKWIHDAGRRCVLQQLDVGEPEECREFVERTLHELGRLDILVNNAAYQQEQKSIAGITPEQLEA